MTLYSKWFDSHSEYETYKNGLNYILPNVSICYRDLDVHYENEILDIYYDFALKIITSNNEYIVDSNDIPSNGVWDWTWWETYCQNHSMSVETLSQAIQVYVGNGFVELPDGWFQNEDIIESIIFGSNTIETLGYIYECDSVLLEEIKFVGSNPYYDSRNNCNALIETATNKLLLGANNSFIPNTVETIGEYSFTSSTITSINIPSSVTIIEQDAFFNCGLSTVTFNEGLITIENEAFYDCHSLSSINIPNSVTTINEGAFEGCDALNSVTIGTDITFIGHNAFFINDSVLTSITINATTPPEIDGTPFDNNNCPIYVPAAAVNAYKSAWPDYSSRIQAIP